MIETFNELKRIYPKAVQEHLARGLTEKQILEVFLTKHSEKEYFKKHNITQIYLTPIESSKNTLIIDPKGGV